MRSILFVFVCVIPLYSAASAYQSVTFEVLIQKIFQIPGIQSDAAVQEVVKQYQDGTLYIHDYAPLLLVARDFIAKKLAKSQENTDEVEYLWVCQQLINDFLKS